jgi:hypothetical protein
MRSTLSTIASTHDATTARMRPSSRAIALGVNATATRFRSRVRVGASLPMIDTSSDGWWAVTRHADVVYVLKHPELFSSTVARENRLAHLDDGSASRSSPNGEEGRRGRRRIRSKQATKATSQASCHRGMRRTTSDASGPHVVLHHSHEKIRRDRLHASPPFPPRSAPASGSGQPGTSDEREIRGRCENRTIPRSSEKRWADPLRATHSRLWGPRSGEMAGKTKRTARALSNDARCASSQNLELRSARRDRVSLLRPERVSRASLSDLERARCLRIAGSRCSSVAGCSPHHGDDAHISLLRVEAGQRGTK